MADTGDRPLAGKTVAFLCAKEGTEQVELTEPWKAVEDAGGTPLLLAEAPGSIEAFHHLDKGDRFDVDAVITQVKIENYDALVLPGGVAGPDLLRTIPDVTQVVGQFVANRKPVAAICHAPWILIDAGVVDGRRMTSVRSLATDLRNAGAEWVDEEVVVDDGVITSRTPDDLPAFCATLVQEFAKDVTPAHALEG